VASYLPALIVNQLASRTTHEALPSRQEYETVCIFCDVSGFTSLSESMTASKAGVEGLARHLNSYFAQMVRIIASEGGDVFKVSTHSCNSTGAQCALSDL
jgi:class 3 adenylate cyclase